MKNPHIHMMQSTKALRLLCTNLSKTFSKCNSVPNLHWTEDQLSWHSHRPAEKQHCRMFQ